MAKEVIATGDVGADIHVRPTGDSTGKSQVAVLGIDGSDSVVNASSRGLRTDDAATGVATGRKTVTTAQTPVQLDTASTPCKTIAITPLPSNSNRVMVGDGNVRADATNFRGIPLVPGQTIVLTISNPNLVWIDAVISGEGVTWCALT